MRDKPSIEIADIFAQFDHLLGKLPVEHWKVVQAIKNCRTAALGGHLAQCGSCDYKDQSYNSCRNRHCPKCGFTARNQWVEARTEELLDCPYFHVVFSVPGELRPLILRNKKVSYEILFKAVSETLKAVANDHLKTQLGFIGVLHTWSQTLVDHPHIHVIVPGGGLNENKTKWISGDENYLLPIKKLSQVFRGKILEMFEEVFNTGQLKFMGQIEHLSHPGIFKDLMINCAIKNFVVYAKKPFAGPEAVLKYLGQYTHRIAISNYRLVSIKGEIVHFKYRDPEDPSKKKIMSVHVKEFMRRFLLHVLPKGFVRIRHFGLLGSRYKKDNIDLIRRLQDAARGLEKIAKAKENWQELLKRLTGINVSRCPACKTGELSRRMMFKSLLNST